MNLKGNMVFSPATVLLIRVYNYQSACKIMNDLSISDNYLQAYLCISMHIIVNFVTKLL